MKIFELTDADGDILTVEDCTVNTFVIRVSGEDGHRSVVLTVAEMARLRRQIEMALETWRASLDGSNA